MIPILTTGRLVLRPWEYQDLGHANAWHSDTEVMRHLGGVLDRKGSDAVVRRWMSDFNERGYGMFAVCRAGASDPIGAVGLGHPAFRAHFTPCVEIGWRLARDAWGHGYATEAARAVLHDGFDRLGLTQIVAFAARTNMASQQVMLRVGMQRDLSADFMRPIPHATQQQLSVLWKIHGGDVRTKGDKL